MDEHVQEATEQMSTINRHISLCISISIYIYLVETTFIEENKRIQGHTKDQPQINDKHPTRERGTNKLKCCLEG